MTVRGSNRLQVLDGGAHAARDLRVGDAREPDLVEGEPDVAVPRQRPHGEPDGAGAVAVLARREWPVGDLAQAVVEAVHDLYGAGGVVGAGAKRALGDVDQLAKAVRRVTLVRPLIVQRDT